MTEISQDCRERLKNYKPDKSKYTLMNMTMRLVNTKENIVIPKEWLNKIENEISSSEIKSFIKLIKDESSK